MALVVWGRTAAVASALVAVQAQPSTESVSQIPFELYQQHLVVTKGSIGEHRGLNLLIDTGTIPSVVSSRLAQRLRLETAAARVVAFGQSAAVRSSVIDGLRIGPVSTGAVPAVVGDLSYLANVSVDAVVGLDVLARTSFSIDYKRHLLTFGVPIREARNAPLEIAWPFVTVRVAIGGERVRLLVDTGSKDLVLFKTRIPTALANPPWRGDKTVRYASGIARLLRLDLRQVGIGENVWDKLTAWSLDRPLDGYPPDVDGVLGVTALGCERVTFDFERGEMGCGGPD